MVKEKLKTTDEILSVATDKQKEIVQKLRSLAKIAVAEPREIVRRGNLTFTLNGKDFAAIMLYQDHVDLGIFVKKKADSRLLKGRGTGKDVRHIEIGSITDIDEAETVRLLKEAAALT